MIVKQSGPNIDNLFVQKIVYTLNVEAGLLSYQNSKFIMSFPSPITIQITNSPKNLNIYSTHNINVYTI